LGALKENVRHEQLDGIYYQKTVHHKHLVKRCMLTWIKLQRFLKEESKIIGEAQEKIVLKFRKIRLGRKVFEALTDFAQEQKISN
jgi:hypothetical protein